MTPTRRDAGRTRSHPVAGYSLVEVMVALVILAMAMTAVFATYNTQQKSFTVQSRVAEMQQNLRQAAEYMARDIRLAGYGIPDNVTIPDGKVAAGVTSIRWLYAKDSTTGPDQVYVLYRFDMDVNQPPTLLNSDMPFFSTAISVNGISGYDNGDLILVTDNAITITDLFQITAAPSGSTLPHDANGYNAATAHTRFPAAGYFSSHPPDIQPGMVTKARFVRYFIDSTTDPAHPTLMVDRMGDAAPQPLAEDIEDMQLTYGLDTTTPADGVVDSWIPNPTFAQMALVRQVRLQFIARARLPEAGWAETRPGIEDGIGNRPRGTTPDGYRRRTYDIVIDLRNSGA
jgi:type IV pilus assembly protein PilW